MTFLCFSLVFQEIVLCWIHLVQRRCLNDVNWWSCLFLAKLPAMKKSAIMCFALDCAGLIYTYSWICEYLQSVFCSCHNLITSESFSGYIFLRLFNRRYLGVVRCLIAVEELWNTIVIDIKYSLSLHRIFHHWLILWRKVISLGRIARCI